MVVFIPKTDYRKSLQYSTDETNGLDERGDPVKLWIAGTATCGLVAIADQRKIFTIRAFYVWTLLGFPKSRLEILIF